MLTIENLTKSFGGVSAMSGVNLQFDEGTLTAVKAKSRNTATTR